MFILTKPSLSFRMIHTVVHVEGISDRLCNVIGRFMIKAP